MRYAKAIWFVPTRSDYEGGTHEHGICRPGESESASWAVAFSASVPRCRASTRFFDRVPTEVIPQLAAPLALVRFENSISYFAFSNVHGHRAIKQDVHTSAFMFDSFQVFQISRPHGSVPGNNLHESLT
jgi:hypothetical protein